MPQLDYPFEQVVAAANKYLRDGHTIHQKFTCAKCGARQTMAEPNAFYISGKCEECSFVTDLTIVGCNFLLVTRTSPAH